MTTMTNPLRAVAAPAILAGTGALMLIAVLAPSPTRFALWNRPQPRSLDLPFPESPRIITQAELDTITDRPLFNADRKKDPPPPSQNDVPGLDTYRLAGVIIAGRISLAIIERKQAKTSVTVRVGDVLDGRTITSITSDGVTLINGGRTETLSVPKVHGASIASPGGNGAEDGAKKSTNEVGGKDHS